MLTILFSSSGVAALSGGESLSSCGSSNNGDGLLTSPPCSPASSGELIICDDHNSTSSGSRVDQLLHGRILSSGLSSSSPLISVNDEAKSEINNSFALIGSEGNKEDLVVKNKNERLSKENAEILVALESSENGTVNESSRSITKELADSTKNDIAVMSNCTVVAEKISDDLIIKQSSESKSKSEVAEKGNDVGALFADQLAKQVQHESSENNTSANEKELNDSKALDDTASKIPSTTVDCKVAIVSPLISNYLPKDNLDKNQDSVNGNVKSIETNNSGEDSTLIPKNNSESSQSQDEIKISTNDSSLVESLKENTATSTGIISNTANSITLENTSSQNTNCINAFSTINSGVVNFSTFSNTNGTAVFPTADTSNGAIVNGLILQQPNMTSAQNIKFLQCLSNNGQVRICNNSPSILLNNTTYPILKNNSTVLGAIQNNLTAPNGGGQVAVTTWNGSPILINANALSTNLNQLNNLTGNNNIKKCNAATQICKNQAPKVCKGMDKNSQTKVCQGANKRPSPVKEQVKCKGGQNNVIAPVSTYFCNLMTLNI